MSALTEKKKTRNIKNLAVAQWLRNMPDESSTSTEQQGMNLNLEVQPENISNIAITVDQASDDGDQPNDIPCNESSVNACSTRPLLLYGNKCSLNDKTESQPKPKLNAAGSARRVKFDMNGKYEKADDKSEDVEKRVKFYDVVIRTAEEDNAMLKRSMTQFLIESSKTARKEKKSTSEKNIERNHPAKNAEGTQYAVETGLPQVTTADDRTSKSRRSSIVTRDFDDVIFNTPTILTTTPGLSSAKTYSGNPSSRSGWSQGVRRANRQRPKKVYLKYLSGTEEVQAPIIKGLVIDVVDNQKPTVVRASKNANIREEFALRQRVEGYRAVCSQSISRINLAQRKLCNNLLNLKKKKEALARLAADEKSNDRPSSLKIRTEELFQHSKGYFPDTRIESRGYNFPALSYPKRRVLTIS